MEDLFDLFDLFEVQPEGSLWRGAVNGRKTASSKLAELFAKSGKPVTRCCGYVTLSSNRHRQPSHISRRRKNFPQARMSLWLTADR